jgi:hypothetical protein
VPSRPIDTPHGKFDLVKVYPLMARLFCRNTLLLNPWPRADLSRHPHLFLHGRQKRRFNVSVKTLAVAPQGNLDRSARGTERNEHVTFEQPVWLYGISAGRDSFLVLSRAIWSAATFAKRDGRFVFNQQSTVDALSDEHCPREEVQTAGGGGPCLNAGNVSAATSSASSLNEKLRRAHR